MSEWTPKVGDKVMVGEHGLYRVTWVSRQGELASLSDAAGRITSNIPCYWLTPAPQPEPDEPTVPGALVRDGDGTYLARSTDDDYPWVQLSGDVEGSWERWVDIPRPITVVLADPAEVERLRAERDELAERIGQAERIYSSGGDAGLRAAAMYDALRPKS